LTSNENLSDSRIDQSQQSRVTFCCSRDSVKAIKITSNVQQREFRCVFTGRHSSRLHYILCCIFVYFSPPLPSAPPSVIFQNTFECPPRANSVQESALSTVRMLKLLHWTKINFGMRKRNLFKHEAAFLKLRIGI